MRSRARICINAPLSLGVLLTFGPTLARADVPDSISYQGTLKTSVGVPVADGNYSVTFSIYDTASGPDPALWTESKSVATVDGGFSTLLGSVTPLPESVFSAPNRFLGIAVSPDPEMTPRTAIVAVPFAYRIATVDGAVGGALTGDLEITGTTQMTGFKLPTGASGGLVLTSDASGNGSWQATATGSDWRLTGNGGTTPGANFLGTSDNQALELKVNGTRALRIEPNATSPNLIGGFSINSVTSGVFGATVGGGGQSGFINQVTDDYGTVSGGWANRAGDAAGTTSDHPGATIGGGRVNHATGGDATVSGGIGNDATESNTTVGGGSSNDATGNGSTVAGGISNTSSDFYTTVSGGKTNTASGVAATIGGGQEDTASGDFSTVPGGYLNVASGDYSFAAGRKAKALGLGCFVWADDNGVDFASTSPRQFLIRASGGVGIGTNSTPAQFNVYEAGDSPTLTTFTQGLLSAGINIVTDFTADNFTPGLFWSTQDNSATKPKAGIYLKTTSAGSEMHLGTSNVYTTGITNTAIEIDPSGRVGIGTTAPAGALDVSSTTGAFIVPRMTTVQRDALTAVNGMIVYNTTTNAFNFREAGAWVTK